MKEQTKSSRQAPSHKRRVKEVNYKEKEKKGRFTFTKEVQRGQQAKERKHQHELDMLAIENSILLSGEHCHFFLFLLLFSRVSNFKN